MKLNKKGFTLIELLAVIAILAILVVVAVPGVLNMYNSGKKSTFESQAKSIWKSLETAIINDSIAGKGPYATYCFDGTTRAANATYGQLELSGTKSVYYKATVANGVITDLDVEQVDASKNIVYQITNMTGIDSVTATTPSSTTQTTISCS